MCVYTVPVEIMKEDQTSDFLTDALQIYLHLYICTLNITVHSTSKLITNIYILHYKVYGTL